MQHNEEQIKKIANEVESDFQMSGLADGLYLDFAIEVAKRYSESKKPSAKDFNNYLIRERKAFCDVAIKYPVTEHLELRTAIDSFLIAFDNAKNRI